MSIKSCVKEEENPWVSWTSFTLGNKLHNEEGPAIQGYKKDNSWCEEYWIDGKQLTKEEFESRRFFMNKPKNKEVPKKEVTNTVVSDYIPMETPSTYFDDERVFTLRIDDKISDTLNLVSKKCNEVIEENERLKRENEELKEYKRRSDWGKINDSNTTNIFYEAFIDSVAVNESLKKEVEHLKKLIGGEVFLPQPPDYAPEGYAIEVIKSLGLLHNHFYDILCEKPDYRPLTVKIQKLIDEVNRCYSKLSKYREFKDSIEVAIEALEWTKKHDILDDNYWAPAQDALKRLLDLRYQE